MPSGIVLAPDAGAANYVDDVVAQARQAHAVGVRQIYVAQQFQYDAIALAAIVGAAVPGLAVGTSVVPLNPRHPLIVASLAQTAQAATHGNFTLGLGLGAHELERQAFGIPAANTVTRLREHLTVLRAVFDDGRVDFTGSQLVASPSEWPVRLPGGTPVPVLVAAMGPKALQVSGELADGTIPYLAGPRAIAEYIVPTIEKAAADAGRPKPRVVAMVPALVTEDVCAGRAAAADELAFYDTIPSYQKILAREGVAGAAELAVVGSHDDVLRGLAAYRAAGATEVVISPMRRSDTDARQDLWRVAAAL